MAEKNPGLASSTPFKQASVSRADLSRNTVTAPIKGGMKIVNSVPKSQVKGK
jgi:hypothetical protein